MSAITIKAYFKQIKLRGTSASEAVGMILLHENKGVSPMIFIRR